MTYSEWFNEWSNNYVKPSSKTRTYNLYMNLAKIHINPRIGSYELEEITPLLLQRFITDLTLRGNTKTGSGLAPNSVNAVISVIQNSLGVAVSLGLMDEHITNRLKRPRKNERSVSCFTAAEQKKLESAVMGSKKDKLFGIVLCMYTGLRIGELMALEWDDIDLENCLINVNKTCHDGIRSDGSYGRITESPKTRSSERMIPLPKQLVPRLKAIKSKKISQHVVAEKDNILSMRSYQRSFELLQRKLGIEHHGFHALRHTFATRAVECGMDVKTLSEILGHKNPSITLTRYTHSMIEHKREMMNRVGKLL